MVWVLSTSAWGMVWLVGAVVCWAAGAPDAAQSAALVGLACLLGAGALHAVFAFLQSEHTRRRRALELEELGP